MDTAYDTRRRAVDDLVSFVRTHVDALMKDMREFRAEYGRMDDYPYPDRFESGNPNLVKMARLDNKAFRAISDAKVADILDAFRGWGKTKIPARERPDWDGGGFVFDPYEFDRWEKMMEDLLLEAEGMSNDATTVRAPEAGGLRGNRPPAGRREGATTGDEQVENAEAKGGTDLSPSRKKAFGQFLRATDANTKLVGATDREVYEWIAAHLENCEKLPSFGTWTRYLREARATHGARKNNPRAGRSGRSTVPIDEI
jgi:hypothetical protein